MSKGFTIIELLVASLLLGMLVTILTMIFNQSSIAWRTGAAGVARMDDIRDNIAELREEADNAFVWNNKVCRHVGLWKPDGTLRVRSCAAVGSEVVRDEPACRAQILEQTKNLTISDPMVPNNFHYVDVGKAKMAKTTPTYTVNVKSCGPDRKPNTYDDIWSWPDDFE